MDVLVKLFNRYGSIAILIFALIPLSDDLIFIPLNVMRYSILKAFMSALIGKFFMNLIVAYSGRFSWASCFCHVQSRLGNPLGKVHDRKGEPRKKI